MKKSNVLVAGREATTDPWDRVLDMIKGLSVDQRLKLAENIKTTAIDDVQAQKEKLESELSQLSTLLEEPAQPERTGRTERRGRPPGRNAENVNASGTRGKILNALRRGPQTVEQLRKSTKTQWLATPLSQLVQSQDIVTDGKRPATYSLA